MNKVGGGYVVNAKMDLDNFFYDNTRNHKLQVLA